MMQEERQTPKVELTSRISTVIDHESLVFPQVIPSEQLWKFEETWVDFEAIFSSDSPLSRGISRKMSKWTAKRRRRHSVEQADLAETTSLSTNESTNTEERPYTVFSTKQKIYITIIATIAGSLSSYSSNIYYPAITSISRDLSVSVSKVDLTITAYMLFQPLASAAVSTFSDQYGRRTFYAAGLGIFLVANLGLALNKTYVGLLILRCIQSIGSSGLGALKVGTISDIVTSFEGGNYIALTSLPVILAPSFGSICGGLLAQYLGWHSIFWTLFLVSAVLFVPIVLMFPETSRSIVDDGSMMAPSRLRCLKERWWRHHPSKGAAYDRHTKPLPSFPTERTEASFNPLAALTIVADPETAMVLFLTGVINLGIYAISISITVEFEKIYALKPASQGLLFVPQLIATIIAALSNARLLDMNFQRYASKAGLPLNKKVEVALDGVPIERARLEIAWPIYALTGFFIICFGWSLHTRCHIFVPIVFMTLFNTMTAICLGALTVLLVDLHQKQAATASAAATLFRCAFGAIASAVTSPAINAFGNGWTFTMYGVVYLASLPLLWICMKRGIDMRRIRGEKEEKTRLRRETGAVRSKSAFQRLRRVVVRILHIPQTWRYSQLRDDATTENLAVRQM